MKDIDAYKAIIKSLNENPIIVAIGRIARVFKFASTTMLRSKETKHDDNHFYLLGAMGAGMAVSLGIAMSLDKTKIKKVVAIEGDGGFFMGMNSLAAIAYKKPKKLVVFIMDNQCYASTGGQPSPAKYVSISRIIASLGLKIMDVKDEKELNHVIEAVKNTDGPHFVHVNIDYNPKVGLPPVKFLDPPIITYRFCDFIEREKQLFKY